MKLRYPIKFYATLLLAAAVVTTIGWRLWFNHVCESIIKDYPEQNYIAHGGGVIDGHIATNSLEAIDNAIAHGIKYIELDLQLTADSILVAAHDWNSFAGMTGFKSPDNRPPTLEEFQKCRIWYKYTPVTYHMIDSIFTVHPDLILVTDKLDDAEILQKFLPGLTHRTMIECFSEKAFDKIKNTGSFSPMTSYPNIIPGQLNVTALESSRYRYFRFMPSAYALFRLGTTTREEADSVFATDRRIRFYYVDIIEK